MKEYISYALSLLQDPTLSESDRHKAEFLLDTGRSYMNDSETSQYTDIMTTRSRKQMRQLFHDNRHNGNS